MATRSRKSTIAVPPLALRAEVVPSSLDEEARTVKVTWTTGARVLRGFYDRFWEELSLDPKHVRLDRLNSGAPLLNSHDSFDLRGVIGVVEPGSVALQKKKGTATVRFARAEDDPEADKIFRKVADKIITNVSVGYRIHKMEKVEDGDDKIPVYRAVDWEPHEISMVPIGADAGAGVRAVDDDGPNRTDLNKCVFVTREQTMDPDENEGGTETAKPAAKKDSPAVAATRAAREARIEDAKARAELQQAAAEEATAAERERMAEIRTLGKRSKLGEAWVTALIENGTPVEEARKLAFEEIVKGDEEFNPSASGARIGAGDDEHDKFIRGASAWLFLRTGTRGLIEAAMKKMPEAFKDISFDPGEFRGYSPVELARLSLERNRVSTRGMDPFRMVGLAFTHVGHRSANYQTAGDFPILLENVLGKVLLGAYATQENTWERFCKTEDLADFRTSNRYRTGSLPGLDVIAEHGEYKSGIVPDGAKYPLATQRLGKMFSISQETIVNDDMGALTDMAAQLGKAAMRTIENSVYALLAANSGLGPTQSDSQPFFHANRANVGTGGAISVDSIDADRAVMRAQKDPSGLDFVDQNPAVLLVPDTLRGTALVINNAEFNPSVSNKFQVPNHVRGLFSEVVSSPRLTGTRRYMFGTNMDAIVVAFLAGQGRGPIMESQDGWRIAGTEWKVTLFAKAQMGDPKSAVTNAGA
jgi:HK97 family phage prohead protease